MWLLEQFFTKSHSFFFLLCLSFFLFSTHRLSAESEEATLFDFCLEAESEGKKKGHERRLIF